MLRRNLKVLNSAVACNNTGMQHEHFYIPQLAVCCANKTRSVRLYKITNRMQTTSYIFATRIFQGLLRSCRIYYKSFCYRSIHPFSIHKDLNYLFMTLMVWGGFPLPFHFFCWFCSFLCLLCYLPWKRAFLIWLPFHREGCRMWKPKWNTVRCSALFSSSCWTMCSWCTRGRVDQIPPSTKLSIQLPRRTRTGAQASLQHTNLLPRQQQLQEKQKEKAGLWSSFFSQR